MKTALKVENLTKKFGGTTAVNNFTSAFLAETVTGIAGPNGAGKTTLFNLITGFWKADAGKVLLWGTDITKRKPHQIINSGIGRTFQRARLFKNFTAIENLLLAIIPDRSISLANSLLHGLGVSNVPKDLIEKATKLLREIELIDYAHKKAYMLSYGQQKLLALSCCMALACTVWLLDEPFAGIQTSYIDRIQSVIHREAKVNGLCILIIDHNLEALSDISDKAIIMANGNKLFEGDANDSAFREHMIRAYT